MKHHSPKFLTLVQSIKSHINEVSAKELKTKIENQESLVLIDVRESSEQAMGWIPTALCLSRGILERDIEQYISDNDAVIILYCSGGFRSSLAADSLQKMGYTQVYSLAQGLNDWTAQGFPLVSA